MDSTLPESTQARPTRWVILLILGLACLQIGPSLWDSDRVQLALDQPARHLPWSAVLEEDLSPPRAPDLSDQAMVFYPAYRQVAQRWARGELSMWNPDIHAGVPSLANPQWGVLDPEVMVLGLLERLGGREAFDHGLAWLALGRLFAAGFGAWLLARTLGLSVASSVLVAVTFQTSGFVVGWLGHSLGHVAPILPWLIWSLERCSGRASRWGPASVCLATLLTWLGGHPETAFFCLVAAGLWTARLYMLDRDGGRRAALGIGLGLALAAPSIFPFLEYLGHSGARLARQAVTPAAGLGPAGLALILVSAAGLRLARRGQAGRVGGALGLFVGLWLLTLRAGPESRSLLFLPGLHGLPGWGGYQGGGDFVEQSSTWVNAVALGLACVSVLASSGRLRGRGAIALGTLLALGLSLDLDGIRWLWRGLPVLGEGAGSRAAVVSCLGLALLAGDGLGVRNAWPRRAAASLLALVLLAMHLPLWNVLSSSSASLPQASPADSLHGLVEPLPSESDGRNLQLRGWIHRGLPFERLVLRVESLDRSGEPREGATLRLGLDAQTDPLTLHPGAPQDSVTFSSPQLEAAQLPAGQWTFTLEVLALTTSGEVRLVGSRLLGGTRVSLPAHTGIDSALWGAVILALWLGVGTFGQGGWVAILLGLALLQGLWVGHERNPASSRARVFPDTATTSWLRADQESVLLPGRFLGGPGVLPYNTGIVHGLVGLDGYDAMDVASFDGFKPFAQLPGRGPLLDWNARGVDLNSPALRLLGCEYLVTAAPLFGAAGSEDWEWVAGPSGATAEAGAAAEVFIYRARDPLPRAFCVNQIVDREQVLADPGTFNPRTQAFLAEGRSWSVSEPFESSSVQVLGFEPERVELTVTLDGQGLLVLCEQDYPGWRATVDGDLSEVWTVNSLLRGVPLDSGEHTVVFKFRPTCWPWVWWVWSLGLGSLAFTVLRFRRPSRGRPA